MRVEIDKIESPQKWFTEGTLVKAMSRAMLKSIVCVFIQYQRMLGGHNSNSM